MQGYTDLAVTDYSSLHSRLQYSNIQKEISKLAQPEAI